MSEALILAATNPQYNDRLFIEFGVQYTKIPSPEHVVYINCSDCQNKNKKIILCRQHALSLYSFHATTGKSMSNLLSYCGLVVARISASLKDLPLPNSQNMVL